jgi:hypothetical protein
VTFETVRARRGSQKPFAFVSLSNMRIWELRTDFSTFDGAHVRDFDFVLPCCDEEMSYFSISLCPQSTSHHALALYPQNSLLPPWVQRDSPPVIGKISKKATTSLLLNTTKALGLVFSLSASSSLGTHSSNSSFLLLHKPPCSRKGNAAAILQNGHVSPG